MKILVRIALTLCLLPGVNVAFAQAPKELDPGYYVVVGAYASNRENVAQNYVDVLNREGYTAKYGFNAIRNLYFVYVKQYTNLKTSLVEMEKTRKQSKFQDAWVRVIPGTVVAKTIEEVAPSEAAPVATTQSKPQTQAAQQPQASPEKKEEVVASGADAPAQTVVASASDNIIVTENPEIVQYEKMTLGNTEVFLSLFNARNNRIVEGEVTVVDTDRAKQLTKVKGNEYLLLPDPKSKSGQLTLICEAFGYRKVQQEINYPLPLADTVKSYIDLMGTTVVINFDLIRYHKGDIATLYHVYFYNDASVMLPESKFELNSLLDMMRDDPNYKIRLHGHTNGNYHGRIISMGPKKNFFSLDGSTNSIGSAKDLSRNRAEVIKDYLVANGIAADRMEVKAWGGKRPLYDRNSVNAKRNVRVEVEILAD